MIEVGNYRYTNQDARKTLIHAGDLFDLLANSNDAATVAPQRHALSAALAQRLGVDPAVGLEALGPLAAKSFGLPGWDNSTVQAIVSELHMRWEAAADALRANGELPATTEGVVAQLNTSSGGLPKMPRDSLDVTFAGVRGDSQNNRQHHGRPWQALCLWNTEGIAELQAGGHPIHAGAAGENITVSGIEWADVRPGTRLLLGETVLAEVWAYTLPCTQQARWLSDRDFMRLHHERGGFSRVYARVLQTGRIDVGDEVTLEPSRTRRPRRPSAGGSTESSAAAVTPELTSTPTGHEAPVPS